MRNTITLLLALLLGCLGLIAQQSPSTNNPSDYTFTMAVADQAKIGNHTVSHNVRYLAGALNDDGDVAFAGRFPDAAGRTGIYTLHEVIAEEGTDVSGARIVQIITTSPHSVQINDAHQVGWTAVVQGPVCQTALDCTAVFIGNKLIAVKASSGPVTYFVLTDDGAIQGLGGTVWRTPPVGTTTNVAKPSRWRLTDFVQIPDFPLHIPVKGTGPIVLSPKKATQQQTPNGSVPRTAVAPTPQTQLETAPTPAYCPASPIYPLPWGEMANAAGPNSAFRPEGNFNGDQYKSPLHPGVKTWSRKTSYSPGCQPIVISLAAVPGVGALEILTPSGLVATFDPAKGSYAFSGVPPVTLPTQTHPIEDSVTVNRRCQILIVPVTFKVQFGEESGMILGSPTKGHCE